MQQILNEQKSHNCIATGPSEHGILRLSSVWPALQPAYTAERQKTLDFSASITNTAILE